MKDVRWVLVVGAAVGVVVSASSIRARSAQPRGADLLVSAHRAPSPTGLIGAPVAAHATPSASPRVLPPMEPDALVQTYCVECHYDQNKANTAGVAFDTFAIAKIASNPELGERMVRKLRLGMMPPPGNDVPDPASYANLIDALETRLDAAAAAQPNPGVRTFQRLNRAEYASAVRDLLSLDVNAGDWLPLDSMSANFDNIADEQMMSATLLESYLNAAAEISRMAIGDRHAPSLDRTYSAGTYESQHPWDHLDGAPFGTRGGIVVKHVFPADGDYVFEPVFISGNNARFEDLDISVDGVRVALVRYETQPSGGADGRGGIPMPTNPITVRAGQHTIAAAFVRRFDGPYEDLIRPNDWSFSGGGSGGTGITTLLHLRDLTIRGPFHPTGISDTPARHKIFTCRPTSATDEPACARTILTQLATSAYRRPATSLEVDGLMRFYTTGATKGGFETGVRSALEAVLANPKFIFRLEQQPDSVKPGSTYRVGDTELASRLSYFLWGRPPDADLLAVAARGDLATVAGLDKQARKMLADPRAEALGTRFAAQWLRLQDIDKVHPDPNFYPNFDDELAGAMRKETILFFNDLVKGDHSALDLYRANYTFVNEALARHYGIPNVAGDEFRKVSYPADSNRIGLFGQGSVLVQTSLANRTSPVLRGKWVMSVLLGSDPPPPPANVPPLDNTAEAKDGKTLTTRERMEMHRANPACASCHKFMDPIGLSLDHFDTTGKWRLHENSADLDTRGIFYDGTPVSNPAELSAALLKRPVPLVRTLTENLMAFALGRRAEYYDQPTIRAITRAAETKDYRMSSLIVGVVTSDAFRLKRADAPPDTSGKGKSGQQ